MYLIGLLQKNARHRVRHGRRKREKRKAQKAKIKENLLSIAWHPSRWWDWCVPEDEKKETEKLLV